MRKLQLCLLLLLALPTWLLAASINTLVVTMKNGSETVFFLRDQPNVSFDGSELKVVSLKSTTSFALADVLRFTYVKKDLSGIDEMTVDPTTVSFDEGILVISQLPKGASAWVYTADGKLIQQLTAQHAGTFRLNLATLPTGLYLVKVDNITYKIMK